MNKALVILNLNKGIGGATKRYVTLFNYINTKRDDYFLVINKKLCDYFLANQSLEQSQNLLIVDLHEKEKKPEQQDRSVYLKNREKSKKRRGLLRFLGRMKSFIRLAIKWMRFVRQFLKYHKTYRFSLVYTIFTGGIWLWSLKKIAKFKLIHSYNDITLYSLGQSLLDFFDSEYWVLKKCDKIDFLSPEVKRRIEDRFGVLDKKRVTVTPNSFIDYSRFVPESPKQDQVVFVGRMSPEKNPLLFLESIQVFNKRYPGAEKITFLMIGAGALDEKIKEVIRECRLENVTFVGTDPEPYKYLGKSKVFVSLQRNNNYPSQALLEAMACENAIIATDVGETRLLVSGDEGVLVQPDAEEIAKAMIHFFSNPEAAEKAGKKAREKAIKNHTIEKFAEYMFNITDE